MSWPERIHSLPDGRQLRATYEGEPVGWVVHLIDQEDRAVAARDIHDALVELLQPGQGLWPSWFMEAAQDLAARDTPFGRRYPCPCCACLTLDESSYRHIQHLRGVLLEDDRVPFHDLDYQGGANQVSLNQARRNFREHGVSETRFTAYVRPPLPEERP